MKKQMKLCTLLTKPFVLFVLLFALGVGEMWGWWIVRPKVYFYNSEGWTPGMLLLGHNANSQGFNFVEVPNTKLWYVHPDIDWHDLSEAHFGIVGNGVNNWDYNNESFTTRWGYVTSTYTEHTSKYDNLQWDNNDYKYITYINSTWTIASGNGAVPTYKAFLRTKVNENDGSGYSLVGNSTTWKASFNFTGTHWSGVDGETAQRTISNLQSNSWMDGNVEKFGYENIPFSGKVRFVKQSLNSAYELAGWGTEGDTEPIWYTDGSGNDVTFYVSKTGTNDNEGVYVAFIKRKQYTVTFDRKGVFGTSTVTATVDGTTATSGTLYNYGQEVVYTANPATGYEVEGWYSDAACTVSLNNGTASTYTVSSLEATSNAYVKFREKTFSVAFTNDGHGSVTLPTSTPQTVGQITGIAINASEYFGYQFNTWISSTGGSFDAAGTANTKFYPTAATTVTANFARRYAYIEANFQVYDATRSSRTPVGNVSWKDDSRAIEMAYDGTNRRYYLHTYSTPAQLAERLNDVDAYFYIKTTSSSSSTFTDVVSYYADGSSNQSLSAAGSANQKGVTTSSSANSFKFTGSDNGYVILYFDGTHVWYELEYGVTYIGNGSTGGTVPTDAAYYSGGATVTVKADPDSWAKTGYTFGGWTTADGGSGTKYDAGETFTISANTTLYAKWTQSITLDRESGTSGSTSVTATYNSATLGSYDNPERSGYTFGGYYSGDDATGELIINTSKVLQANKTDNDDVYTGASGIWKHAGATTLHAQWEANDYTINLANMEATTAGTESVTVTFDASTNMTASDPITKPTKTHYDFGGYWTSKNTGATLDHQLIGADGKWIKDVAGYTSHDGSGNPTWVHDYPISLYAKWTEHEYAVTLAVSPAGTGTTSPASSTTAKYVTASGDITATPNPGYSFREWDFSKTDAVNDIYCAAGKTSTSNPVQIHAVHDGTLTANFTPNTYTVRFENLGADAGHKGSLDTTVTFNDTIHMKGRIEVPSKSNYDFGGYYTSANSGATLDVQLIDENGNWKKGVSGYTGTKEDVASWVYAGNITLYAKWTETAYTITPSVSPAGAGSVNTVTDAHLVTPSSDITATPTNAVWVFNNWTCGTNVGIAGGKTINDNPVTVTASQNSTITANFAHRYNLLGSKYENEGKGEAGGMPGWSYGSGADFTINSYTADGDNATVDLSYTCTLEAGTYIFEIHDRELGESLGRKGDAGIYVLTDGSSVELRGGTDKDQSIFFYPQHAGQYTFRITYMRKDGDHYYPTVTIERPHQIYFGTGYAGIDNLSSVTSGTTGGTLAVTTSAGSLSNEDWVSYGTDVTYTPSAATGYTFEGFYTSDEYSSRFTQDNPWVHYNVTGDDHVYAKFEEKSTSVTLANDGHGKVQISSTDKTSTTCGVTTTRELTAVPNDGYMFSSWTKTSGDDITISSTSTNPTTLSGLGSGAASGQTVTANFTYRYAIKGTMNGENWDTDHLIANIGTNAGSKDTGYVEITLPANTTYEFAIYDKKTGVAKPWLKNGTDKVYNMTYTNHTNWPFDTEKTYNCGITTAGKGTYKFIFNITDKTMTVIYPDSYQVNYGASVGGSVTSVKDDDNNDVPNGGYVRSGGSVTYTATPNTGYTFVGWCGNDSYGDPFNTELSWTNSNVTETQNSFAKFKSTNFVIYRSGDKDDDPRAALDDVESYDGGTISEAIEFRMKVRELDKWYTLCLPFTVNAVKVWDEEDCAYYPIVPYYRSGGKFYNGHYIIRTPASEKRIGLPIAEFDNWYDPENPTDYVPSKDVPYIIQWHDSYFTNRYISFFGATGQTIATDFNEGSYADANDKVNVYGNNTMHSGSVAGAYMLDADYGAGAWLRLEDASAARTILPFECFVRASETTTQQALVIRRDMIISTPTGFDTKIPKMQQTNKVIINGQLFIIRDNKMYNIYGKEVQQ